MRGSESDVGPGYGRVNPVSGPAPGDAGGSIPPGRPTRRGRRLVLRVVGGTRAGGWGGCLGSGDSARYEPGAKVTVCPAGAKGVGGAQPGRGEGSPGPAVAGPVGAVGAAPTASPPGQGRPSCHARQVRRAPLWQVVVRDLLYRVELLG